MRTMLALVAALVIASPAFAGGGQRGDWEIGGFGGYGWTEDYGPFHPEDDVLWGARLGYFLSSHWSMEASGTRLSTETEFEDPLLAEVGAEITSWRLNFLYNVGMPTQPFRPFLTAGAGAQQWEFEGYGDGTELEWNAGGGFRWFFTPLWSLRLDGRYVGVSIDDLDDTMANFEATAGLSLTFGGGEQDAVVARPPNQPPTVTCASDRAEILPGESVTVTATASDPDGDPLTYTWTTTSGRVVGTGATATLDFTGATPPADATVNVAVSDGQGHTVSSTCAVRLMEPVRQAEAVSCMAGGFPRNAARLTNVDKACLDDVVQRLKSDPRATVVVIGHAGAQERTADQIGQQRADAVRDYMASAGIETTRITVRSVGSTKPMEGGTEVSNRRVEVWFVPQGATGP